MYKIVFQWFEKLQIVVYLLFVTIQNWNSLI